MRTFLLRLLALLLCTISIAPAQTPLPHDGEAQLVYVAYLSRHGVRSPTSKSSQYDRYSANAWPAWSVDPGYLTPHGYELMKLFGTADRSALSAAHLFASQGCDDAAHVTIHADSDQRTRETAKALAEGFAPGCNIAIQALDEGTNDPLFHLPPSQITPALSARAAAGISGRIGGDPQAVATAYHAQLLALDEVLAGCQHAGISRQRTSIFEIPSSLSAGSGDHLAELRGPLATAATLSEILLLEYADDKPMPQVGWGCVDGAKLRSLIDLHTASFDLAQKTPDVAVPQAAALLRTIALSLQQATSTKSIASAQGKPGDKALFLVGHDTNLANIAGALSLNWLIDGRRDDTPPGSALAFELWRKPRQGQYFVRLKFRSQTLEQMREGASASDQAPAETLVFIPGCSSADGDCELSAFLNLLEQKSH